MASSCKGQRKTHLLLMLAVASGCYVVPPLKVRAGGGSSIESSPVIARTSVAAFDLAVGAHPQQVLEGALERVVDVGAGYHLEALFPGRTRHAAYVEVNAFVPLNKSRTWRLVPRLAGEAAVKILPNTPGEWGPGGTVGFGVEAVMFFNSNSASRGDSVEHFGGSVSWGEGGFGFDVAFSFRHFSTGFDYAFTFGVTLRTPASAGFYVSWLFALVESLVKR